MKKVLFVINSMTYGGIQKALLNLLMEIKDKYEITLLLIRKKGAYINLIPKEIEVLHPNCLWSLLETSNTEIKNKNFFLWVIRGLLVLANRYFGKKAVMKFLAMTQKRIGFFDIAISYHHPTHEQNFSGGCNEFVLYCCKSDKKITFVHCDYSKYGGNSKYNNGIYAKFNRIAVVSLGCRQAFLSILPQYKSKTICVYNCHNYVEIKRLAQCNPVIYKDSNFVIVTISRLSVEKGILRALGIFKRLMDECIDLNLKWYIIGDGEEHDRIKKEVEYLDLNNNIILEGSTTNPYRYLPNADVFLLPSIHEAAPMVIGEALSFGIPVISTETSSTIEMINENEGFICENSGGGIYTILKMVIENPDYIKKRKGYLNNKTFTNDKAIAQFEELLKWR